MRSSVFVLFLFFTLCIYSQRPLGLSGSILDEDGQGVEFAIVALFSLPDSLYVKSEISEEDGRFQFQHVSEGTYDLRVEILGYNRYQQNIEITEIASSRTLVPIKLEKNVEVLDQVVIKATVPYIEQKIDRVVVTPDALISNAGNNALEVLERSPGISINSDGSLLLKGRSGVTVFINDKPSYLSGTELQNYLMSLPAESIQQLEIMTNPPAKYEAAGNSGVINIVTKRSRFAGFFGNATLGYRQGRYSRSNNSLNLNFNKGKLNINANAYAGYFNGLQDLFINRYYKDDEGQTLSSFSQNSFNRRTGRYVNVNFGVDLYASEKTTIGAGYKFVSQPNDRYVDNTSLISNPNGTIEQRVVADNDDEGDFGQDLLNLYISRQLDTLGSTLSVDADFVRYSSDNDQEFKNYVYSANDSLTYEDIVNGRLPSEISIYAAKTDLSKTFKDGSRLELGLKTAFTKTDNEAKYTTTINEVTTANLDLSNRFLYEEWINAGYVNCNRSFGVFEIQAGLRLESTELTGEQQGNEAQAASRFKRNYTSIFPTFYASAPLDSASTSTLTFSYGRRIDRPFFQDLNPFIRPLDRFTFYAGNPNLLPTYSHNFSLSHAFKGILNTTLDYSITDDGINETLEIREGIYYSRPGNIANSESLSLSFNITSSITDWYSLNSYLEFGRLSYKSDLYTEQLNSSGDYYYLMATNTFQLGKDWKADVSGRYQSDIVYAQLLIKSYFQADIGVQKQMMQGKATLKCGLQDLFLTRRGNGIINNLQNTDADWNSTFDSRVASLTFSYRFGNSNSSKKRQRNSSGSEEEQGRVRG